HAATSARDSAVSSTLGGAHTPEALAPPPGNTGRPRSVDSITAVAPPAGPARPHLTVVHSPEELDDPIANLKGMRKPMADSLQRVGVESIRDLVYYFPRTHYDYADTRSISRMRVGEKTTLVGTIESVRNNRTARGIVITTATVADDTG